MNEWMVAGQEKKQDHPQAPNVNRAGIGADMAFGLDDFRCQIQRRTAVSLEHRVFIHQFRQTEIRDLRRQGKCYQSIIGLRLKRRRSYFQDGVFVVA